MTSKLLQARNDTLITRATGEALTRLGKHYGFERPLYIPEGDFKSALKSAVYASQPTLPTFFEFVRALFNVWAEYSTVQGEAQSASTLALDAESLALTAPANLEQRFAIVGSKVCFLSVVDEGIASFAPIKTSYFSPPAFTVGEDYAVKLLPFTFQELDCVLNLIMDGGIFTVPSTFLQQNAEAQEEGEPPYGFLMDFFSSASEERFGSEDGPYPAYLASDFFESRFFALLDRMLASGVQLRATNILWAPGETSMYNSFKDLLAGGGAGGGSFSIEVVRA